MERLLDQGAETYDVWTLIDWKSVLHLGANAMPGKPAVLKCSYCGSDSILQNIATVVTGPKIKALFDKIEPFLVDLCLDCGTAVRFHVENTDRNWDTRGPR
jgi:hypothetical protein